MRALRIFLILLLPSFLFGQDINIPNNLFLDFVTIPCPYDTSGQTMITTAEHWIAYQTLDDRWDGIIDSTQCINIEEIDDQASISISEFDKEKPIFVRNQMDSLSKVLLKKNWVNSFQFFGDFWQPLEFGLDDSGYILSGSILRTEVVDVPTDTSVYRTHLGIATSLNGFPYFEGCYPTEKSSKNYLVDYILKFTLDDNASNDDQIHLGFVFHDAINENNLKPIESIVLPSECLDVTGECDEYFFSLVDGLFSWNDHFVFLHANDSFPSPTNIYTHEIDFDVPQAPMKTINLFVQGQEFLHFQPYVETKGAFIAGSDSIRHELNIVNNGGQFCVDVIVEFTIEDNTRYVHNDGEVLLSGPTSCFRVQDNGKLIVGENAHLAYGKNGQGMLLLGSGGAIELRKNAALTIDNHLFIFDYEQQHSNLPQELNIYLEKGNTLTFGPNAQISSPNPNDDFKLNVYMNGGVLDDRNLSAQSRQLIRRIYPTPAAQLTDNIQVFPNPNDGQFEVAITTEAATKAIWSVWTMDGKQIAQGTAELAKGINYLPIVGEQSAIGLHYVRVEMEGEVVTKPVIIK